MTYDDFGYQVTLTDKDAATSSYQYDAYGQLILQSDLKSNTYGSFHYDELGNVTQMKGSEGIYSFSYFTTENGINNLSQAEVNDLLH